MFRSLLVSLLCFAFTAPALAAMTQAEIRQERDRVTREIAQLQRELSKKEKEIDGKLESARAKKQSAENGIKILQRVLKRKEQAMKAAQKQLDAAKEQSWGEWLTGKEPEVDSAVYRRLAEAKEALEKARDEYGPQIKLAEKDLKSAEQAIREHKRAIQAFRKKTQSSVKSQDQNLRAKVEATEAMIRNLDRRIDHADLTDELLEVKGEATDSQRLYDKIEDRFDRAVVGAYVQEKMGQLLNSKVLCEAAKSCGDDGATVSSDRIQKELFPSSKSRRSNYKKRLRRRSGQ